MKKILIVGAMLLSPAAAFAEDVTLEQQVAICEKHRPECKGPKSTCMGLPEFDFVDPDLVAACHKHVNDLSAKTEAKRKIERDSDDAAKLKQEPVK